MVIGFHIKSDRVTCSLVDLDTVAVNAINIHVGDTELRNSPSHLYSFLKESPVKDPKWTLIDALPMNIQFAFNIGNSAYGTHHLTMQ